jgi:hypothetical protein
MSHLPSAHDARMRLLRLAIRIYIANVVGAGWPITSWAATPPRLAVETVGPFQIVFDWKTDRCDPSETADVPPRAFRDASGMVHLAASQDTWREHVGVSLDTVKHDCRVHFRSARDADPAKLSGYEWLASPYTADGKHIDALVHNEYHPNVLSDLCPSHRYTRCWSNTLTYVHSEDGGQTFIQPSSPKNFVAGLPYPYKADLGFPIGYFQPSNIVEFNDFYYVLFTAPAYLKQQAGTCIMRTNNLSDPGSWRGWNGRDFSIRFVNPYTADVSDPQAHLCNPLAARLGIMGGVARDPASGAFILVTQGGAPQPGGHPALGIVALASFDLISWSDPVQIWRDPSGATTSGDPRATDHDPSILDPTSPSRNFDVLGGKPYIYFVRDDPTNRPYDRRLMRVQTHIEVLPSSQ